MTALFYDQLERQVEIPFPPQRIISLVPSQTELLYNLGSDEEVAGITRFCIHPEKWFHSKTRVGGTKQLHMEVIDRLQPDLIIGNKEENEKVQLETLMQKFPVWVSDVHDLRSAVTMIRSVGEITGRKDKAIEIAEAIEIRFTALRKKYPRPGTGIRELKAAYFIWRDPWMAAGGDTFIHDMLQYCGLVNCFGHLPRYPEVNWEQLKEESCELVMLSSEPFPFKEKHVKEMQELLPDIPVILVDGTIFSWYGSRLLQTPEYLDHVVASIRSGPFSYLP